MITAVDSFLSKYNRHYKKTSAKARYLYFLVPFCPVNSVSVAMP